MKLYCSILVLAAVAFAQSDYKPEDYNPYGTPHHRTTKKCGPPKRPQYGGYDSSHDSYEIGHTVTYHCNDGYDLYGPRHSTCSYSAYDDTAKWGKETPYCRPSKKPCPKLKDPDYGEVKQEGVYPGDGAWYKCKKGHDLVGNRHRICQKDGTFSGNQPTCEPIDCGDLSPPKNGSVSISPNKKFGATATYYCDKGFKLRGVPKRKCQYDGKWSGHPPTCKPRGCGYPPPPPKYGDIYYSSTGYGSKVRYSCKYGYYLYGRDTLTCLASGKYSHKPPVCHKYKDCKDPGYPKYGTVKIEKYGYIKRAVFHCKHGYNLVGSKVIKCNYNGTWTDRPPVCKPVDCGYPDPPNEYGSVHYTKTILHSMATYSCKHGYKLVGSKTVKCLYFGKWSDKAPVCKPIDCGCPPNPNPRSTVNVGSTKLGSKATYECDHGYQLVGEATIKCLYDKKWSNVAPLCEPIDCGSLPAPTNGAVEHVPHTLLHSIAKFSCDKGFKLIGKEVLKCLYDGKYSGKPPVCKKIKCPDLKPPVYGEVYVGGNHPGDYARYRCDYGYGLKGSFHRVCTYEGVWTGSDPKCIEDPYMLHSYDKDHHRPYGYDRKDHSSSYGRKDHDSYGRDSYGKKDHDSYGHDSYGKKDHDPYGHDSYGDSYGKKDHDSYGDSYGKKDHDSYGHDSYGDSYGKKDHDSYGDSYGKKDHDSYGKKDHDSYGDSYGKKDHDSYGRDSYGDSYGKKDHDSYGDSYGKKDHDSYGHDSYGKKDHDPYGDSYGKKDHDSYGHDSYGKDSSYGRDPYDKKHDPYGK